jgi:hypothetical protein
MNRSILYGLLAPLSVGAVAALPIACGGGGAQSTGVGDPCIPALELNTDFAGFNVAEEDIETGSSQCPTGICLVNNFQGRVSCPAGQAPPKQCHGTSDTSSCATGQSCVLSETQAPACTPCAPGDATCVDSCLAAGFPNPCDPTSLYCACTTSEVIGGVTFVCEPPAHCSTASCPMVLNSYVCHTPGDCQAASDTVMTAEGKDCCFPGSDSPVAVSVCGQCDAASKRNADEAVYCSCRCCAPCCPPCPTGSDSLCLPQGDDPTNPSCSTDTSTCGSACDPNFDYCTCPSGFSCVDIRPFVGLGNAGAAGAYCVKSGTAFQATEASMCGAGAAGGYVGDTTCSP